MKNISFKDICKDDRIGKKGFLRCDLNVPFDNNGVLLDDTRINNIIPTIKFLLKYNCKIILASHFGRPNGEYKEEFSLKKLIPYLQEYLKVNVLFINDILSSDSIKQVDNLQSNEIVLLENLRFYPEEQINNTTFAKQLSKYADIYINDAFSCCHREHSSICAITNFLPSYPGLSLMEELKSLSLIYNDNYKPQTLIIGGKKISTKIKVLNHLANKVDRIFIAGAMANNFLKALGYEVGKSYFEEEYLNEAKNIYENYKQKIVLPHDFVGKNNNKIFIKNIKDINKEDCILDIGIKSCINLENIIENSKILIWNGPIGFYEEQYFSIGSLYAARTIAYHTKNNNLVSIIGGGDAVAVAKMSGLKNHFSYISSGGGAFLEIIEKGDLIGFKNLKRN